MPCSLYAERFFFIQILISTFARHFFRRTMEDLQTYEIQFRGLSEGEHDFQFKINNEFFKCFEKSEIRRGSLIANICLIKKPRMLEIEVQLIGRVEVPCDRCLEPFISLLDNTHKLYVKFSKEPEEETEDLILLSEKACKINLAHYIYEFIHLSLPYKKVHPEDASGKSQCNPEMLKKLDLLTANRPGEDTDSRWKELKEVFTSKK